MDESKVPLNLPVRDTFRMELEHGAMEERIKLSKITELILGWSVERLVEADSVNRPKMTPLLPTESIRRAQDNAGLIELGTWF
jgi:hypothetical protein